MLNSNKGQHKTETQKAFLVGLVKGGKSYDEASKFMSSLNSSASNVHRYVKVL